MVGKIYTILTQKRNSAENDFEKDFIKLLKNALYGKTMEKLRNRVNIEFFRKDHNKKVIKQQSKVTFNGFHKTYTNLVVTHLSKMKYS